MSKLTLNTDKYYIKVEDYDDNDTRFVKDFLVPYLKDLFRDLILRCMQPEAISQKKMDKVTFIEYCNLPGIINDRLFNVFDLQNTTVISEQQFVSNFVKIFISDLDTKMRLTFDL